MITFKALSFMLYHTQLLKVNSRPETDMITFRVLSLMFQNTLYLSLNLDIVFITYIKAKLMVFSLRSQTLPLQYISLLSILDSALLVMLQRFGMMCLLMCVQKRLSTQSERSTKPISLHKLFHPNSCFSRYLSMVLAPAMSQVNDYSFLVFLSGAPRVCL